MKTDYVQEKIIISLKKDLNILLKKKINTAISSFCFVATWGENIGFQRVKYKNIKKSYFFPFLITIIKDWFSLFTQSKIELSENNNLFNYKKVILSTASLEDFQKDGSYIDRYLKINSNNHSDFLYLLLYTSKKQPQNICKNILLFKKKRSFFKGVLFLIKYLIKNLSVKNFFYYFSEQSNFAIQFMNLIKKKINFKKVDYILAPFEGIPYQQNFILEVKKINKNIKTIGYDHSAPHAMPLNMFYREGSPDTLLVNGSSQINFMKKFLNWPNDKLREVPSLRYSEKSSENFKNIVFLPWKIFDSDKILKDLELFLNKLSNYSLSPLKVKTHPIAVNKDSQAKMKLEIENLFNKFSEKFSKESKKSISIFIGSTTGVIVALEKGLEVIHICFDPIFDSYSELLWPELNVENLTSNTFIYTLKKKGSFIKFGNGDETFKNFYNL